MSWEGDSRCNDSSDANNSSSNINARLITSVMLTLVIRLGNKTYHHSEALPLLSSPLTVSLLILTATCCIHSTLSLIATIRAISLPITNYDTCGSSARVGCGDNANNSSNRCSAGEGSGIGGSGNGNASGICNSFRNNKRGSNRCDSISSDSSCGNCSNSGNSDRVGLVSSCSASSSACSNSGDSHYDSGGNSNSISCGSCSSSSRSSSDEDVSGSDGNCSDSNSRSNRNCNSKHINHNRQSHP